MKAIMLAAATVLLAGGATAQSNADSTDEERRMEEVETRETLQTSGKDRIRGSGDELVGNVDRAWAEQITCKTRRVTGSRIAKERVCRTNAQWRAQQEENQRSMRNVTMGQSGTPG